MPERPDRRDVSVRRIAASRRKGVAFFGLSDGTVDVVDYKTGRSVATLGDPRPAICGAIVNAVECAPNEHSVAIGRGDGVLGLWDTETWNMKAERNAYAIQCLAYTPDSSRLAVIEDGRIRLIDVGEQGLEPTPAIATIATEVSAAVFYSTGVLLTGHTSGEIVLWNVAGK